MIVVLGSKVSVNLFEFIESVSTYLRTAVLVNMYMYFMSRTYTYNSA